MNTQVAGRITGIIHSITKVPTDKLGADVDLRAELAIDSLSGLQIIAAVEKEFAIIVPDDQLGDYFTIRQIVQMVDKLCAEGAAGTTAEQGE